MIICADDFGLREDIDEAILELCRRGRVSAVSCMVELTRCDEGAMQRLLEHQARVDIGLHLCLTDEGLPLSAPAAAAPARHPSFCVLLRDAWLGRLRADEMFQQVSNQYDLFVQKSGRRPDYIDGHLHVHQLPAIRRGLLNFVSSLPPECRPYIRNTHISVGKVRRAGLPWMKAGLIGRLGVRMRRDLQARQLPTNEGLTGIYDFADWRRYPQLFPKFASCLSAPNGLLVTHPGRDEAWRESEFDTLRGYSLSNFSLNRFQRSRSPVASGTYSFNA